MSSGLIVRVLANLCLFSVLDNEVQFFVHSPRFMILLDEMMDLEVGRLKFLLCLPGGLFNGGIQPLNQYQFLTLLLLNVQHFLRHILFFRVNNHSLIIES